MVDDEGKFRESIWSINPNWRGWFYGVLLACGFGVSIFTVWTLCGNETSESWIDIFDAVWNGIVGSVVVVWFLFQAVDWATPRAIIPLFNYIKKIMAWGDPYREAQIEKARKEAEAYQKLYDEYLMRNYGLTKEQIQQAHQQTGLGPPPPPFPPSTK